MTELPHFWHGWDSDKPRAVYRCYDADGDLLYVGSSGSPQQRMKAHRLNSQWWGQVARIEAKVYPTKKAAMDAEWQALLFELPRHNRDHRGWIKTGSAA